MAWPLTEQLKKDSFKWSAQAAKAFEDLKQVMTTIPVLALSDFSKVFVIETNACGYGVGAVLLQDNKPVAYFNQVLGQQARTKPIYEKELMAIIFAVKKW